MFLPNVAFESLGLPLLPAEYVQAVENETLKRFLLSRKSPYAEWEIRDGFVEMVKFDKPAYEALLRKSGISEENIAAFVKAAESPNFNAINRRGMDRLRLRLAACREVALKLMGPEHEALKDVPVGVAIIDYLNAGAHPVPGGGNAILMNFGLCFLNDFYILKIQLQNEHPESPPKEAVESLSRLARAIFGSREHSEEFVTAFPRSLAASDETQFRSRISMALAFLFVLLHEYGHITRGHTEEFRKWPRLELLSADEREKYYSIMREWEFEADEFAFDSMSGKKELGTPIAASKLRIMLTHDVFSIMTLAQRNKSEASSDHPLPKHRLYRLCGAKTDAEFIRWLSESDESNQAATDYITKLLMPILIATGAAIGDASPAK